MLPNLSWKGCKFILRSPLPLQVSQGSPGLSEEITMALPWEHITYLALPMLMGLPFQRDQNPILFSLVAEQSRFPQKFACIVYFSASSKGNRRRRRRTEMAASPSLFFLPGKCDSFLLEGNGVRKGGRARERGTTACSKRLQCGAELEFSQ